MPKRIKLPAVDEAKRGNAWKGGRSTGSGGYAWIWMPDHPSAQKHHGYVAEHILIAEAAVGHPLPPLAEVHHVDENRTNNLHGNLVVCENHKYHGLLHARMTALRSGADPDTTYRCKRCREIKPLTEFNRSSFSWNGRQDICATCSRTYSAERRERLAMNNRGEACQGK